MLGKRSWRSSRPAAEQTRSNNRRHPTPWSSAAPRFQATFNRASKMGRGCRWCTNAACCRAFQDHLPELREWREEMRSLRKERHNAEVLLIFAPRLPSALNAPRPPPPAARESNRSATSEVSCCTSQESCGSDACREDLIPDRKTKFKVPPAERPESDSAASCVTSPSGSASSFSTSPSGSASSCSTKSSCSTSPSKPAPRTSKRLKVNKKAKVKKPATRSYRRQINRKHPSIDLGTIIFPPGTLKVCRKSALHFLGTSETRVRRVCDGLPDGRTRGHRLPNDHPSFSKQWLVCLVFLHNLWHYFGEGLPDRFSFETGDGCASRLTLGTGTKPSTSRDHRGSEFESDTDSEASDADEEDERALSALSLHIHSVEQADTHGLRGPGLGRAPCRYIGVMRPVQLYATLSGWCQARGQRTNSLGLHTTALAA